MFASREQGGTVEWQYARQGIDRAGMRVPTQRDRYSPGTPHASRTWRNRGTGCAQRRSSGRSQRGLVSNPRARGSFVPRTKCRQHRQRTDTGIACGRGRAFAWTCGKARASTNTTARRKPKAGRSAEQARAARAAVPRGYGDDTPPRNLGQTETLRAPASSRTPPPSRLQRRAPSARSRWPRDTA